MVKISITPKRGNNARFFPHHGYLGLSPVIISGTVSTRLEKDGQPLEASKVVIRIRCYEGLGAHPGQGAGLGSDACATFKPPKINVLWETEKTLWTPSASSDHGYGLLGDTDTNWKLVIPVSATQRALGGHAVGSMTYRTWKAWWQVEAVILHKPTGIYGSTIVKTHPIFLPNYSRPIPISIHHPHHHHHNVLQSACSKFTYSITSPSIIACGDLVKLSITLSPLNSSAESMMIKNLSVSLQRTLAVEFDPTDSDGPSAGGMDEDLSSGTGSGGLGLPSAKRWKLRHLQARSRSLSSSKPSSRLNSPGSSSTSTRHTSAISTTTTLVETDCLLSSDLATISQASSVLPARTIALQIPKAKSRYHYSIGDSCRTKWAVVNYSLVVKVTIKSKSSGIETITLNALPVELMSVPNTELNLALQSLRPSSVKPSSSSLSSNVDSSRCRLPDELDHHNRLLRTDEKADRSYRELDLEGCRRFLDEPGLGLGGRPTLRLSAPPCNS